MRTNPPASRAAPHESAIIVRLEMTGAKKNQAKVRAALRRELANMLHSKGGQWFFAGSGKVEVEWRVDSLPPHGIR